MATPSNLTGVTFGRLVALERVGHQGGHALWRCWCECGDIVEVTATNLKRGNTTSCGCFALEVQKAKLVDITGRRYGRLLVTKFVSRDEVRRKSNYECLCDCGKTVTVESNSLRGGHTRSCGCLHRDVTTKHGMHGSSEYKAWSAMIQRCFNPKNPNYRLYGARGITVCDRWRGQLGFENFYSDNGPRPSRKHSIDRHPDNNGNYEPGNVRWATASQQLANTRNTRHMTHNGETMCASHWARRLGIPKTTFYEKLRQGLSISDMISG